MTGIAYKSSCWSDKTPITKLPQLGIITVRLHIYCISLRLSTHNSPQ
jgi:hypothetical protein